MLSTAAKLRSATMMEPDDSEDAADDSMDDMPIQMSMV